MRLARSGRCRAKDLLPALAARRRLALRFAPGFAPPGFATGCTGLRVAGLRDTGDPARALVLSQIILSLALPIPMIPLVLFTMRRDIMGPLANRGLTNAAAIAGTVLVLGLDMILLVQTAAA